VPIERGAKRAARTRAYASGWARNGRRLTRRVRRLDVSGSSPPWPYPPLPFLPRRGGESMGSEGAPRVGPLQNRMRLLLPPPVLVSSGRRQSAARYLFAFLPFTLRGTARASTGRMFGAYCNLHALICAKFRQDRVLFVIVTDELR
jgi:hypothetical protein